MSTKDKFCEICISDGFKAMIYKTTNGLCPESLKGGAKAKFGIFNCLVNLVAHKS